MVANKCCWHGDVIQVAAEMSRNIAARAQRKSKIGGRLGYPDCKHKKSDYWHILGYGSVINLIDVAQHTVGNNVVGCLVSPEHCCNKWLWASYQNIYWPVALNSLNRVGCGWRQACYDFNNCGSILNYSIWYLTLIYLVDFIASMTSKRSA